MAYAEDATFLQTQRGEGTMFEWQAEARGAQINKVYSHGPARPFS